jgi:phosphinothricin acetyltransferase
MGFEPVGVYGDIGFKLSAWHSVGWWQLWLGGGDDPPAPPAPLPSLPHEEIGRACRLAEQRLRV